MASNVPNNPSYTFGVDRADVPGRAVLAHWERACGCRGASATYEQRYVEEEHTDGVKLVRHFAPACDTCNTVWRLVGTFLR